MRKVWRLLFVAFTAVVVLSSCASQKNMVGRRGEDYVPKREFRGAWMQVVNGQYEGMTSAAQQRKLLSQLDALHAAGVNAVFFQVRPEADALYKSYYEPWSRFLTGRQGVQPDEDWDPLQFMITACHARGMELHAWINPYRAKMKGLDIKQLSSKHPYNLFPDRFVDYDGMLIFKPSLQQNRDYICTIVSDIVRRYDIDGIHVDDYFYPYPVAGKAFPDAADFLKDPRGFTDKNDWRRDNVNLLIRQLSNAVHGIKPWVKFGVSPFGIYHNDGKDAIPGSATSGLQNYDDLYADILLWIEKGWVDYTVPQLYWQIGHSTADYATLVEWWARNASGRPLFIGQDLERSLQYNDPAQPSHNQLARKFALMRSVPVSGYCWWYADAVRSHMMTTAGRAEIQRVAHAETIALQPTFPFIDKEAPGAVTKLAVVDTSDGPALFWTAPEYKDDMNRPVRYVVYRFEKGQKVDINKASHIVATTTNTFLLLSKADKGRCVYVVTALDRLQNESKASKIKVKL